MENQLL